MCGNLWLSRTTRFARDPGRTATSTLSVLRNVVAAATSSAPRANAHDASEDNTEESEDDDEISESGEAAEDVDAVPGSTGDLPVSPKKHRPAQRCLQVSSGGPTLARDPSRAAQDAEEKARTRNRTSSNRLGGGTFALSGITSMCWAMRARGPRVRAKKWMDQREKEVRNEEAKNAAARNEMMGLQIYLREESNLRSENKAIRRREDSEQREPLKKLDAKSVITLAAKKLHPQNSTDRRTSPKAEPVMRNSPLTEKKLTSDTSRG
ncbi:hypothetical protein JG688_00015975 [Phytophthora aleatoria]|uniref:Uncharacterized protein n=1 Tax=Phytophthora aleatoria TaxID=2496075 RepID=A0A8J5M2D8_9STRA|nr:hypothetical protein JG688_00015975 [Phytophthora aleatoria]